MRADVLFENNERTIFMKTRLTGLFVCMIAGATPLLSQSYKLTDLGAVPGQNVSAGYGLNAFGQAVGDSSSPNGALATLFSGGKAINLGTLVAGDVSVATCINGATEIAGYEPQEFANPQADHAWIYSNGKLLDIHSASLFPNGTQAFAINDSGVVVGQGWLTSSSFHAFVYANGQIVDIGPPGSYQASAIAINNNGQILGNAFFTSGGGGSFIYANGKFSYLTSPPGSPVGGAYAMNSLGEVVGEVESSAGTAHAAVYSNGTWVDLGGVTGAGFHATGINTAGQIIATAFYPVQSYHPFRPGKHVAYIIGANGPVLLNSLIAPNSGYTLTDAIAINDDGQILCDASTTTSPKHAVLLTPK
jgi:probable HAF family extracellular repeat protein